MRRIIGRPPQRTLLLPLMLLVALSSRQSASLKSSEPQRQQRRAKAGCDFPDALRRHGPWAFQQHLSRDPATGARLLSPADELRYALASVAMATGQPEHPLGRVNILRRLVAPAGGPDAEGFRESAPDEPREALECLERASGSHRRSETFLTAHYHSDGGSQQLSGYLCVTFDLKIDERTRAVFAVTVYLGQVEPHRFPVANCPVGELSDKWAWIPEPRTANFRDIPCPFTFSYRAVLDWIDATDRQHPRPVNLRSGLGTVQENTFTLVQSQCVAGTGMSWLFYNVPPISLLRVAPLSLLPSLPAQDSIQVDMRCAGSWTKHNGSTMYHFTLLYNPNLPMSVYTLRIPAQSYEDDSAEFAAEFPPTGEFRRQRAQQQRHQYREAMLYEGAAEVLSTGWLSGLLPARGHLLSRDEVGHARFRLTYRRSLGDCDNHIRGCLFSESAQLGASMQLRIQNCRVNSELADIPCQTLISSSSCSFAPAAVGNWIRPGRDGGSVDIGAQAGELGGRHRRLPPPPLWSQDSSSAESGARSLTLRNWPPGQDATTASEATFACRAAPGFANPGIPDGVYVMQKVPDRRCASIKSCLQTLLPLRVTRAETDLAVNNNLLFLRISHDTALSESHVSPTCTFMEKSLPFAGGDGNATVPVSRFQTVLARGYQDDSVYCGVNFYTRYNFSTARSRLPCLYTLQSDTKAYDSFHFGFVSGSVGCLSDVEFATRKYTCLGGYNINSKAFNPAISRTAFMFHTVITYFDEASQRRFNCWLIVKTARQLVSRMLLFDTAQCGLLFAADSRSVGDGPVYLEGVEEAAAAAVFHNPELYPAEAMMGSVMAADRERRSRAAASSPSLPAGASEMSSASAAASGNSLQSLSASAAAASDLDRARSSGRSAGGSGDVYAPSGAAAAARAGQFELLVLVAPLALRVR